MRTLIVTADPGEAMRWETALAARGHRAERAQPGADAQRLLADLDWQFIIVRATPDGAATQFIRQLRARRGPERPFVLAVLAPGYARDFHPLLRDGADDVLIGALEPATMRARILAAERRVHTRAADGALVARPPVLPPPPVGAAAPPRPVEAPTPAPAVPQAAGPRAGPEATRLRGIVNDLNNAIAAASGSVETTLRALPDEPVLARSEAAAALEALRDVAQLAERLALTAFGGAGGGTPVPLALPAEPPPTATALELSAAAAAAERITVLLIDDDARVRRPLRRALEVCGWAVVEASDGDEGLQAHQRLHYAISAVVVDLRMPRVSGLEVIRELRRRAPSLPVVLVSGQPEHELALGPDAMPDAFLRKPFELVDLARTVRRLLEPAPAAA